MAKKYPYSKSAAPKNWTELATWLKAQPAPTSKPKSNLHARLDNIEKLLKDKQ